MLRKHLRFTTTTERHTAPLLIIDKAGTIGNALVNALGKEYLTVLVTGVADTERETTVHIPFGNHIPRIPDNTFPQMLVIYNGEKETLAMLSSLAKKRDESGGRLFFCLPLHLATTRLLSEIGKKDMRAEIVIYGEIFGRGVSEQNQMNVYIQQVHLYGRLFIPNTGLHFVYPILLDDLVLLIIGCLFSGEKYRRPLLLFQKHPPTALSVARLLVRREPEIKIDFVKERDLAEISSIPDGEYIHPVYDLSNAIIRSRLLDKKFSPPLSNVSLRPKKKKRYGKVFQRILLLLFILLLPCLLTFGVAGLGGLLLGSAEKSLEKGQFQTSRRDASWSQNFFTLAEEPATLLSALTRGTGLGGAAAAFQRTVRVGMSLATSEGQIADAVERFHGIAIDRSLDPKYDFLTGLTDIKEAVISLEEIQSEGDMPPMVTQKVGNLSQIESIFANTQDILPSLFGFNGPKTYLLLFQNNMELRPGGGFIGSYATFTLDRGKMHTFAIHNVYDADGRLTGHVEPPYPLRRYMQVKHWFLRDSNFDPDFGNDAKMAAYFLQLETGQKADIVLGVDVSFLQKLLALTGPLYIPTYRETVGVSNFYSLTEKHAQDGFFPGSTQKQDFLRAVFSALELKLTEGNKDVPLLGLAKTVLSGISEKHLIMGAVDDREEKLLAVSGLSPSLLDERPLSQDVDLDYLGIDEANLGANKANYYVSRSIQQEVAVSDNGNETSVVTVKYDNKSASQSAFGGDYKDYIRFILPSGANLTDVTINGEGQSVVPAVTDPKIYEADGFTSPSGLEVQTTSEGGKKMFGFLVVVPKGEKKVVQITYDTVHPNLFADNSFTYDLFILKQPGTGDDPYHLTFRYPNDAKVISLGSKAMTDLGGKIIYDGNLTEDRHLVVQLSRK